MNKNGFSLIEIVVILGLLSGISLVIMKNSELQMKQSQKSEQMLDGFQVSASINSTLLNANACQQSFSNLHINSDSVSVSSVRAASGSVLYETSKDYGAITIVSMRIDGGNAISANSTGNVNLRIVTKNRRVATAPTVEKSFPLAISLNGSRRVTKCYGALDGAVDTARQAACVDIGGNWNQSLSPICRLSSLNVSGAITTGSVVASGAIEGASLTSSGAIQAGSLTSTGMVQAGSFRSTGAIQVASVASSGNVQASSFTYSSDRRLKKNIRPLEYESIDKILKLKPVQYQWKKQSRNAPYDAGLIAQEVQEVFPEIVFEGKDGLSVDYVRLVPHLLKAIQEQQKEIDDLKQQANLTK